MCVGDHQVIAQTGLKLCVEDTTNTKVARLRFKAHYVKHYATLKDYVTF